MKRKQRKILLQRIEEEERFCNGCKSELSTIPEECFLERGNFEWLIYQKHEEIEKLKKELEDNMKNVEAVKEYFSFVWYLKQLLPLSYETFHGEDSKYYFTRWHMWFGRRFWVLKIEITKDEWNKHNK